MAELRAGVNRWGLITRSLPQGRYLILFWGLFCPWGAFTVAQGKGRDVVALCYILLRAISQAQNPM